MKMSMATAGLWCILFLFFAAGCDSAPKSAVQAPQAASANEERVPDTRPTEREYPTMRVWGRHLYTAWNEKIVLRGVNHMFIWLDKDGDPSLGEIARTGANSVRLVWLTSGSAGELDTLIHNCISLKMVPLVELHDATGKWENLKTCVDYWVRPDVVRVLRRHQKYLLVNIANEAGDNRVTPALFVEGYSEAVRRMREAGVNVPLIIDAPDWGKNFTTLKKSAAPLVAADPRHNMMFSIHMWWPRMWGYSEKRVRQAIHDAVSLNIPLIVGEFGHAWDESDNGKIPYLTILEESQKNDIGWLAWSWGPGNHPQTWLNMTKDGRFDTLENWGKEVAVTNAYSIRLTSRKPPSLEHIDASGFIPAPLEEE